MKKSISSLLFIFSATAAFSSLQAEVLKQAEITQIINEVSVIQPGSGERPASVSDVVQGKLGVRTGQKSRAELVFADQTLTRLGANTIFNFEEGTRNLDLKQGVILLQVPKNAGGATIRTAAVTAAITGTTILFEHTPADAVPPKFLKDEKNRHRKPHGYLKIMVLEGTLKVWLKKSLGESILLGPGKLLVTADDATWLPDGVDFDVEQVVKTSKLINDAVWIKHHFRWQLIDQEIANQRQRKSKGDLLETNLFIQGRGTNVELAEDFTSLDHSRDGRLNDVSPPDKPDNKPDSPNSPPPPKRETVLENFRFTGSTDIFNGGSQPQFNPAFKGNAKIFRSLPDSSGGITVLPTSGRLFNLISTAGNAEDGNPLTGTMGTAVIGSKAKVTLQKTFVEFDYRFLTDEIDRGPGNDLFSFTVTGSNGDKMSYTFDKNLVVPNGQDGQQRISALGRKNVGGFFAGTDWLTLKLEITPLLQMGSTTFTLQIIDEGDGDVTSAVAIDRFQITKAGLVAPNSDMPGSLSLSFTNSITLGEGVGELRAPGFRGRENTEQTGPGSDGGSFFVQSGGDIIVNTEILADTGPNKDVPYGGAGGNVRLTSSRGKVAVNRRIQVSSDDAVRRRVSERAGSISIAGNSATGNSVEISNTGQLLALLNASSPGSGGAIYIDGGNGNVLINGGRIIATRGSVDVRTQGNNALLTVRNADIHGDIVKIGSLGNQGNLTIGGGQISADTTLKLYAGGSNGTITFVDNTKLGSATAEKVLAARVVTVNNGVNVSVQGRPADVYTNIPNYSGSGGNGSTTGRFTGTLSNGDGAVTHPSFTPPPPPFDNP